MLIHIDLIFFLRCLDVIIDAMDFGDGSNNISNDKDVFDYSKIILEKGFAHNDVWYHDMLKNDQK